MLGCEGLHTCPVTDPVCTCLTKIMSLPIWLKKTSATGLCHPVASEASRLSRIEIITHEYT